MDKNLIRDLYLKGYNAVEISKKLYYSKVAVQKCIQRNFQDLKELHLKNKTYKDFHKTQVKKAIEYEAKKFMSDKTFVLKNRSIYETQLNGDITLRQECKDIAPWDAPKKLSNELMI